MKKIKGAICTLFLLYSSLSFAQSNNTSNFHLTFGTSTGALKYTLFGDSINKTPIGTVNLGSPPIQLFAENSTNRALFGIGISYENYLLSPQTNNPNYIKDRQESYVYVSAGIRAAYKLIARKKNSFYMGGRLNYLYANKKLESNKNILANGKRAGLQLFLGNRYFFTSNWAFTMELAIGRPYFAMAGFTYKLN